LAHTLALLAVLGIGAAITWVIGTGNDEAASAAPFSQVQASCGDWIKSSQGDNQSDDQWCTDMFAWMSDQSGGSMMDSLLWQGADQMSEACRAWVGQDRGEMGASGPQRRNDMIEWMDGHMTSRDGSWLM
jgi:hypothetical protein